MYNLNAASGALTFMVIRQGGNCRTRIEKEVFDLSIKCKTTIVGGFCYSINKFFIQFIHNENNDTIQPLTKPCRESSHMTGLTHRSMMSAVKGHTTRYMSIVFALTFWYNFDKIFPGRMIQSNGTVMEWLLNAFSITTQEADHLTRSSVVITTEEWSWAAWLIDIIGKFFFKSLVCVDSLLDVPENFLELLRPDRGGTALGPRVGGLLGWFLSGWRTSRSRLESNNSIIKGLTSRKMLAMSIISAGTAIPERSWLPTAEWLGCLSLSAVSDLSVQCGEMGSTFLLGESIELPRDMSSSSAARRRLAAARRTTSESDTTFQLYCIVKCVVWGWGGEGVGGESWHEVTPKA